MKHFLPRSSNALRYRCCFSSETQASTEGRRNLGPFQTHLQSATNRHRRNRTVHPSKTTLLAAEPPIVEADQSESLAQRDAATSRARSVGNPRAELDEFSSVVPSSATEIFRAQRAIRKQELEDSLDSSASNTINLRNSRPPRKVHPNLNEEDMTAPMSATDAFRARRAMLREQGESYASMSTTENSKNDQSEQEEGEKSSSVFSWLFGGGSK